MEQGWKQNLIQINPYVPGEQPKDKDIIKLNANENPYPPSPKAQAVLHSFQAEPLRLYPDADGMLLKKALAEYHGVSVQNVFLGNGSDDVIALCFQAFFRGEKPILFPDITYSFYPVWCSLFRTPYATTPLSSDYRVNLKDYRQPNGGVILPNPNAPTGIGEGTSFVRDLLSCNRDSVVILDEAYGDFSDYSATVLLGEYENLLVVKTFSKSRSLAGLRIGYALGGETLIATLEAVKNAYNSYTVDRVSLAVAAASIEDEPYFQQTVSAIKTTRQRVTTQLRKMGFTVLESAANFVLMTKTDVPAPALFAFLKDKKIYVRYFNLPRIDNHLRVTIGTEEEMDAFLQAVEQYLQQKQ